MENTTNDSKDNAALRLMNASFRLLQTVYYALNNALQDREEFVHNHTPKEGTMDADATFILSELDADIAFYQAAIHAAMGDV
jgi:hypothetical protein